jgi:hypothetical protein
MATPDYFGYYHFIRDNIYDFRLRSDEFNKLIIFNLAMIIARGLNIEYFQGRNISGNVCFFQFKGFDERFVLVASLPQDQVFISILEDNKPYVKISNSGVKLNLDYFNNQNKSSLSSLSISDTDTITLVTSMNNNSLHLIKQNSKKYYTFINDGTMLKPYLIENIPSQAEYILTFITDKPEWSIDIREDEFLSLYYNCLPTPLISVDEIRVGDNYIEATDRNYHSLPAGLNWAIAIDPSDESKDKDDAIRFDVREGCVDMYVYISDVSPYINPTNKYLFDYCAYKQETEYITNKRYPMIDSKLSENQLSLMGNNKKAIEIKITYGYIGGVINRDPLNVQVRKVKNLNVYATTYTKIHQNCIYINYSSFKGLLGKIGSKRKLYNNFVFKNNSDINISNIFTDTSLDSTMIIEQLRLIHIFYEKIGLAVDTMDKICTFISSNEEETDPYESWIHALIELTAVEANKYIAMIEYKYYDTLCRTTTVLPCYDLTQEEIIRLLNELTDKQERKGFYRVTDVTINVTDMDDRSKHYYQIVDDAFITSTYEIIKNTFNIPMKAKNITYPRLHKGLNTTFYTHFTSPLRRFCDLTVHNLLFLNYDNYIEVKFDEAFSDPRKQSNNKYLKIYESYKKMFNYLRDHTDSIVFITETVSSKTYYNIHIPNFGSITYNGTQRLSILKDKLAIISNINIFNLFELNCNINFMPIQPNIIKPPIYMQLYQFMVINKYNNKPSNYIDDIIKYTFGSEILRLINKNRYDKLLSTLPKLPLFLTGISTKNEYKYNINIYKLNDKIKIILFTNSTSSYCFYLSDKWYYDYILPSFDPKIYTFENYSNYNLTINSFANLYYYYCTELKILFVIERYSDILQVINLYENINYNHSLHGYNTKYLILSNSWKSKYLKYKNKYIELKNKLTK